MMPEDVFDNQSNLLYDELRKMGVDVDLIGKYSPTVEQLRALRDGLVKAKQEFEIRSA